MAGEIAPITSPLDGLFTGGSPQNWMQALQGLFGGQTNSSSNQNTQQSTDSSSTSTQIADILSQVFGKQTGKTTGETTSPLAIQALSSLLPMLMQTATSQQFTKEAAISDSRGGVQNILKDLKENALPGVFSAEAAGGGYNSTTRKLLSNDLAARAAAQAESLVSGNVKAYADIQNQQTNSLANAITAATNAQRFSSAENISSTEQDTTGRNITTGQNAGNTSSKTNVATTAQQNTEGLLGNKSAQTTAGLLAALYGLGGFSGIGNLLSGAGSLTGSPLGSLFSSIFGGSGPGGMNPGIIDPGMPGGADYGTPSLPEEPGPFSVGDEEYWNFFGP